VTSTQKKIREFIKLSDMSKEAMVQVHQQFEKIEKNLSMHLKEGWKKRLLSHLNPKVITERLMPIYEEHYSEKELDALLSFYKSSIGKKWMKTQKKMVPRIQGVVMKWFGELSTLIEKEVKE
jgi:hypothetical protein